MVVVIVASVVGTEVLVVTIVTGIRVHVVLVVTTSAATTVVKEELAAAVKVQQYRWIWFYHTGGDTQLMQHQ